MRRIIRAEPGYLACYYLDKRKKSTIAGKNLELLEQWLTTGEENDAIVQLKNKGVVNTGHFKDEKENLMELITRCRQVEAPLRSLKVPESMNIELTDRCPLRCPQCYCHLNEGKDIKKETALKYIEEAARLQIPYINMCGGETMVYPYLTDLIEFISSKGLHSAIAISGWGFNQDKLKELKRAGIDEIFVSLNGSTEEVNSLSRDGYHKAINTLQVLQADQEVNYYINWVARNDNVADFPRLVNLAQNYGVKRVYILTCKPDASNVIQESLSKDNFLFLADFIKNFDSQEISLMVESCYSPLRAYIYNYYFFNRNTGENMGCGAGRKGITVDLDGNFIPCNHLVHPEKFDSIDEYWWNSKILDNLRRYEEHKEEPCRSCHLTNNCRSCRAVGEKVYHNLYSGHKHCHVPYL
ncbi:MAG: radical SAM protein [Clostridiales bacterium]|nr:radical SAM protein [Clostridiales bacterium]MCF8022350.1 radical SAM protein [Clostridiales bacterium]